MNNSFWFHSYQLTTHFPHYKFSEGGRDYLFRIKKALTTPEQPKNENTQALQKKESKKALNHSHQMTREDFQQTANVSDLNKSDVSELYQVFKPPQKSEEGDKVSPFKVIFKKEHSTSNSISLPKSRNERLARDTQLRRNNPIENEREEPPGVFLPKFPLIRGNASVYEKILFEIADPRVKSSEVSKIRINLCGTHTS